MIETISNSAINGAKMSALPSRPNAPKAYGGGGMSSAELRAKMDALAMVAVAKINEIINLINAAPTATDALAKNISTGIAPEGSDVAYSLAQLFDHITDGTLASYLKVDTDGAGLTKESLDIVLASKAPIDSPIFTGQPKSATPANASDGADIATTAWVRALISTISAVLDGIQAGTYGNVPTGGESGTVLAKSSDADFALEWKPLADFAFNAPTAVTQQAGDNTTKVATTAFVKAAIDALKNGVSTAYDTLQEIAAALEENAGDINDALQTIAEKDNKTTFNSIISGASITLASHNEYRASAAVTSLTLTFPTPDNDFIASLEFDTDATADMTYSYNNNPDVIVTGDDCDDGVFVPCKGYHYTVVYWYAGNEFQGVVRRAAVSA